MLRSLRGFVPWIAFGIINGVADLRVAAVVAVILSGLLMIDNRRTGHGLDEAVIETSATIFFIAVGLVAFLDPTTTLGDHTGALAAAWLAITAWGSLLVRHPFTMGIARRSVPREVWENPLFYKANVVITTAWAISFTVTAVAQVVVGLLTDNGTVGTVIQILGFVAPAIFTVRYQAARQRDAAALQNQFGAQS
jgi:hypothetical protein